MVARITDAQVQEILAFATLVASDVANGRQKLGAVRYGVLEVKARVMLANIPHDDDDITYLTNHGWMRFQTRFDEVNEVLTVERVELRQRVTELEEWQCTGRCKEDRQAEDERTNRECDYCDGACHDKPIS